MNVKRCAWLFAAAFASCVSACNTSSPVGVLTDRDCPDGARVVGAAPPAGLAQRCELSGGVRHGLSRAWYDNGRLRYQTEWRHGVKHGQFTFWYQSGGKKAEGRDREGLPDGTWTAWNEDGTVAQQQVFDVTARETGRSAQESRTARQP